MVAVFFSGLRDRRPALVSFCANKGADARGGTRASLTAGAKRVVFRLQWENVFFPEPCEGCFDCCTSGQEKPWPTFFERRQNLGPHRGSSADRAGGPGVGNRPRSGCHHRHHPRAGPAEFRLIEKDSYWAAHHAELERPAPAVQVLNADALAFPWESLEGPWKIISNLPYNVGSPLMWDIVSRTPDLTRAVFMVQKEVAERLYAKPGNQGLRRAVGLDPELCPGRVGLCGRARCVQSASEGGFRRGHVHPPASGTASR